MATVWGALRDGEPVAIKVVRDGFAQDEQLRRLLLDEARLVARVDHPNICRFLEIVEGARPALIMERVDGPTLAAVLDARGALPEPEARRIAAQVARGLHAAHEARGRFGRSLGLVHRDVSPSNVMLTVDGVAKLIDFGVARAREHAIQTSAGTLKGKLRYLAPEQVTRQPVDRRTDVYALGIVLWEMLTGQRYLDGRSDVEVLLQARSPRRRPPSLFASVSDELAATVLKALAVRPGARFPTAATLASELEGTTE